MNKDKLHTPKDFHGTSTAVFVVEQRNRVLARRRWGVYTEYPQLAASLMGTFRWRWMARREMKKIAGVRSWEDVNH